MIFVKKLIFILVFISSVAASVSAQVRVSAQVDTGKDIYVGESFGYYIILEGTNQAGLVDLEPLRRFNPISTGNKTRNSVSIINNKTIQRNVLIMTYSLTVNKEGPVTIPTVTVTLDGKSYVTNPVSVNILKPGTTDQLDLEMSLSDTRCYVGQPVVLTINFYVSADIGDFQIDVPAFTSGDFEIEDSEIIDPQARQYRLHTGVNVLVSQSRVTHNSRDAILVTFNKILIPKRSGLIRLGPAFVSADVAVGRTSSSDSFFEGFLGSNVQYKRFIVDSEPLELNVLALPDQDKPEGFYGLIGNYTISADATPTNVNVGDPITLTIKIGGSRYLKPVQWPDLEQVPGLAADFKIPTQKASPTIEDGFKVFTQTIRANNDRVTEIPPIPLAYFDAEQNKYNVVRTEPIKLEVAPTKILTNADLEGSDFAPVNKEVEAIKKGLSANYESLDVLENMKFSPVSALLGSGYTVVWSLPLAALVLSIIIKVVTNTTPEQIAAKRRRQSCGRALRRLKKISSGNVQDREEQIVSIMKQYIGDRFDRTAGSLTPDDCYNEIITAASDVDSAEKYKELMAEFEAARYAPIRADATEQKIRQIHGLIKSIEKKSRR